MKGLIKRLKSLNMEQLYKKKFKKEEQKNILMNISLILNQGYSLNETIRLVSYRLNLKSYLIKLSEGEKFSEVLRYYEYDNDVLLIIKISEDSGQLKDGVEKAVKILDTKMKNKNQLFEALKYPIMLSIIMLSGVLFISKFIIPMFINIYDDFGIELSPIFKVFFKGIEILPMIIFLIAIIVIITYLFIRLQTTSKKIRLLTKNKFIRKQYFNLYNQIFLMNITMLLDLGLKIDEVFKILSLQNYNLLLKRESKLILKYLRQGDELSYILTKQSIYSKDIILTINDGEKYGILINNLKNYLLIVENEKKKKFEKYIFLIQPLFYGIFGIMIILLYASIFIPMFKIMDSF